MVDPLTHLRTVLGCGRHLRALSPHLARICEIPNLNVDQGPAKVAAVYDIFCANCATFKVQMISLIHVL